MDKQERDDLKHFVAQCALGTVVLGSSVIIAMVVSAREGQFVGSAMEFAIGPFLVWFCATVACGTRAIVLELRRLCEVLGEQGKKDEH